MLVDEVTVTVRSGDGGAGAMSFRHEKCAPDGGPDGGDGGRGGDVVIVGNPHLNTLLPFVRKRRWRAEDGHKGMSRDCFGSDGQDAVLEVPLGTIVRHADTSEVLADLTMANQRVVIAAGGKGGWGNTRYKTATNQAPRQHGHGEKGIELKLALELKLIAEVGIIGFPNAGKSTLLSRLSKARPKIAPYPFTTLTPQLGVVEHGDRQLVLADIPGLIEGAAEGKGLGHQFLRHIERCRLLLHLVDGSEGTVEDFAQRIATLNRELARFAASLAGKPQMLALTKTDTRPDLPELAQALSRLIGSEVLAISAASGQGMETLQQRLLARTAPAE